MNAHSAHTRAVACWASTTVYVTNSGHPCQKAEHDQSSCLAAVVRGPCTRVFTALRCIVLLCMQAVKIMLMLTAFMGVMWCLGLLPSQQDPQLLEARIQQHMMEGQGDVEQQQEVVQRAFGEVGHEEL